MRKNEKKACIMICFITILSGSLLALWGACKTNRNFNSFLLEKVESLVSGDSFKDLYIPNSYREKTIVHISQYLSADERRLIGTDVPVTFYYKGQPWIASFRYVTYQEIYCCFSGGYDQCKPSGDNNDPQICFYDRVGIPWWTW